MTYIVLKPVTYTGEGNRPCQALPGDTFPGFADLPWLVREALISQELVRDCTPGAKPVVAIVDGYKRMVHPATLPLPQRTEPPTEAAQPAAQASAPAQAKAARHEATKAALAQSASKLVAQHPCKVCGQTFATPRGLKRHTTNTHKG